jgi:hypothetical protein
LSCCTFNRLLLAVGWREQKTRVSQIAKVPSNGVEMRKSSQLVSSVKVEPRQRGSAVSYICKPYNKEVSPVFWNF